MFMAIVAITLLGACIGLLLGLAGRFLAVPEENPLVSEIEQLMPGSQCGQCGFAGCGPAAKAIAEGEAEITCCPPGGRVLVENIAQIMGIDPDTVGEVSEPQIAAINESLCTGCTKCFRACPTDAVVGANGQIHVVMTAACTGCEKCMDACPEDCITMEVEPETLRTWHWQKPAA